MAEEVVDTPIEGGENLPSSIAETTLDPTKWDITALEEGTIKEGKMFGQYDNIADLHAGYKALQDKHTDFVRQVKESEKTDTQTIETIQATREAEQQAQAVMSDLVTQVVKGAEITEEMQAQLSEHNLDVRDLKLNAIEYKEQVQKSYEIVGGSENYEAMINWAKTSLSEAEIVDFDKGVSGPSAHLYIKGLYSDFTNASGQPAEQSDSTPERVAGESSLSGGVRGYATQAEMLRDAHYVNNAGKNDAGARKLHQQRLSKTSDDVIYG